MKSNVKNFKAAALKSSSDLTRRRLILNALRNFEVTRNQKQALFQDWGAARELAAAKKWDAILNLDKNIELFTKKLESNGAKVHWAKDAESARSIILQIIREKKAKLIVKSKSMTSEEIHLNDTLTRAGFDTLETDLGEFIVQLRGEGPFHIVFPAMHLTRGEIRELFQSKLGDAPSDDPEALTMVARRFLREKYIKADIGITGANFAVAETGMISITENEGNARLVSALPRTMITLVGIEKIIPRLDDLALFLPMLATAGAGQLISCYNTLYSGPRRPDEPDGPSEHHVILLDNGRTKVLADPVARDLLRCIRCGNCLNVCPVFRNIGGHSYGAAYCGPIGSVLMPIIAGIKQWYHLSYASSLCGACTEACPVKIDLHHHLLKNRRTAAKTIPVWWQKLAFKIFNLFACSPVLWRLMSKSGWFLQFFYVWSVKGTCLDPAYPWTKTRELPPIAKETFREWYKKHE